MPEIPHPHEAPGLEAIARRALEAAQKEMPPDVRLMVFAMHVGEGGYLGYVSNVERESAIDLVFEWLGTQDPEMVKRSLDRVEKLPRFSR